MKTIFILSFILLLLSFHSHAQQTIDKLNVNQLKLPKESANKALILDGAGQVKSSSTITDTELGYLEGLTDTLVNLLLGKANDGDVVKLSGNQSVGGVKTFTGKLVASSTVNGSIPCPVMTEAQRDAFTPIEGDCVYNSDTLKLNVFDGAVWKDVGGAGGISLWLTANPYNVNDIIIESDKIYRCLIAHTSGTFATDLAASKWIEVSSGLQSPVALADGGTGVAITPTAGSIVYVDADSFEQVSGTAGQVLQSNGSGAPTFVNKSISAKSLYGSSVTAEEIQVPNNLLTQVDTNKHLNETGNKNILINPSFEHSTFSTGWTNSAGTFSEDTIVEIDGLKAAKLVLSSETMSLSQSSTLYASQFVDGVQGLASVRVKSDVALKVCSIQAGVVSTTNCVDVQANNKWGLYKVPFILGATSNGISIASLGAVSGTIYIDDAFVGAASLTQNMNACNSVSCTTEFSAKLSSVGVTSDENLDWISTSTNPSTGNYTINFVSGVFSVSPNCTITSGAQSASSGSTVSFISTSASSISFIISNDTGTEFSSGSSIVCQKQGADFTAAKQLSNGNTYSSTNADTDWASCGHTTSSFAGFGTVSNIETQCKRQGGDLLMRGKFTTGTTTAVEARVSLPLWNGVQLLSAGSSILPSIQIAGNGGRSVNGATEYNVVLIEPSVSYVTFGFSNGTNAPLTKAIASTFFGTGNNYSFTSRIPIEGWQNSNLIIAQLSGLESCSSTLECTDTFSAKQSAGVVSQENVDWIDGSCSGSSASRTCTFKAGIFTVAPNCSVTSAVTDNVYASMTVSSTSVTVRLGATNNVTYDYAWNIICQKQGVDYIGKTAKAVSSDQNISTPGTIKSTFCSAKISSTGVISDQKGGCFASCTNATMPICTFTSSYWASGQTPNCWHSADVGAFVGQSFTSSTTFSGNLYNSSSVGVSGARTYFCHGERQ